MKRLLILNPNSSISTTHMMVKIAKHFFKHEGVCSQIVVEGHTAELAPTMLTNPTQLDAAAEAINSEKIINMANAYDGVIVAAFGDPGLSELQKQLRVPAVGIGESSMLEACQNNRRFGIATTTPELTASTLLQVKRYRLEALYTGIQLTTIPPLSLAQHPQAQIEELASAVEKSFTLDGAQAVIIGGGPLGDAAAALQSRFQGSVISPIDAACRRLVSILFKPN